MLGGTRVRDRIRVDERRVHNDGLAPELVTTSW